MSSNSSSIELEYTMSVSDVVDKDVYNSERDGETGDKYVGVYKVTRIVNSVNYRPGEILNEEEVKILCDGSRFKVTIK